MSAASPFFVYPLALIPWDEGWFYPFEVTAHIGATASATLFALLTLTHLLFLKLDI